LIISIEFLNLHKFLNIIQTIAIDDKYDNFIQQIVIVKEIIPLQINLSCWLTILQYCGMPYLLNYIIFFQLSIDAVDANLQ